MNGKDLVAKTVKDMQETESSDKGDKENKRAIAT
jgi:hypothetical protein